MTAKEYLSQAYRLDQRIDSNIAEITRLREMACGISSPSWEEKVQTSRNTDAPFVRCLEKIMDLEKVVNSEIDTLVDLKRQIRTTVDTVANVNERMVLRYRYIVWLITLLANQSILIHNLKDKEHPKELLTKDVVELLTTPLDLAGYKTAITEALYKGTKRNVESEKDAKNAQVG